MRSIAASDGRILPPSTALTYDALSPAPACDCVSPARERAALRFADAVTHLTPGGVSDEVYEEATEHFTEEELANKQPVMVINQSLAKRLWPNEDAIGQHLRSVASKSDTAPVVSTVIGVVADRLPDVVGGRARVVRNQNDQAPDQEPPRTLRRQVAEHGAASVAKERAPAGAL